MDLWRGKRIKAVVTDETNANPFTRNAPRLFKFFDIMIRTEKDGVCV